MKRSIRGLWLLATCLLLLNSCSPANAPALETGLENELETEQPSGDQGGAQVLPPAEPGQVVIAGTVNLTYSPVKSVAVYTGGYYEIQLYLETQYNSAVRIIVPEGIQPGSYDIVNLINLEDGVTARFDYNNNGALDYFESTSGIIELGSTGDAYTGSFTVNAADPRDQSRTITVAGNFDNVTAAQ